MTHHCLHSPSNHVSPTDSDWSPWRHSGGQGPGSHGLCWTSSNWQSASGVSGIIDLYWQHISQHSFIHFYDLSQSIYRCDWQLFFNSSFLHKSSVTTSSNSSSVTPHLKRVLCPAPQVTLQEAQLDHKLQKQLLFPGQVRLVQVRPPSAQLQLLQLTWCWLPAAQLCPNASVQSHCHSFTQTPSCCSSPTYKDVFQWWRKYLLIQRINDHPFKHLL